MKKTNTTSLTHFYSCIKHHTKSPEKTSTGAYIIPNAECLKKCSAIYREKLKNVQSGKSRKRIPTTQTYPQKSPYEIPGRIFIFYLEQYVPCEFHN